MSMQEYVNFKLRGRAVEYFTYQNKALFEAWFDISLFKFTVVYFFCKALYKENTLTNKVKVSCFFFSSSISVASLFAK